MYMSKALVIAGADFSTNKLDTITLSNAVYCTGVTLSSNTMSFTTDETQTLTATTTPANTTEALTWASSNTNVATVSNGVVTPVGNGSATITAVCGSYSASCNVTVSIPVTVSWVIGCYYEKNSALTTVLGSFAEGYTDRAAALWDGDTTKIAYDPSNHLGAPAYAIPVTGDVSSIKVTVPDQTMKVTVQFVDYTQNSEYGKNYALRVGGDSTPWTSDVSFGDRTIEIPSEANGFFVTLYSTSEIVYTTETLNQVTIELI